MGTMEKNIETTIVHLGYMGIMEKKMETTNMGYLPWALKSTKKVIRCKLGAYQGILYGFGVSLRAVQKESRKWKGKWKLAYIIGDYIT